MGKILLSFDTEEFDVPRENDVPYTVEEGVAVSAYGTSRILDILKRHSAKATFFCTVNFAEGAPDIIRRIITEGHEIASHGVRHWEPQAEDAVTSRPRLQELTGQPILGYRQPRMFHVDEAELRRTGYIYNTSLNPCFIPGHYNHLDKPRTPFMQEGVLQIPVSVTPTLRIPLFWLALHNFPYWLYQKLVDRTINHDGYFATYMHPWEFYPCTEHPEFKMKFISQNHAGPGMEARLDKLVAHLKAQGHSFITYTEFAKEQIDLLTSGDKSTAK